MYCAVWYHKIIYSRTLLWPVPFNWSSSLFSPASLLHKVVCSLLGFVCSGECGVKALQTRLDEGLLASAVPSQASSHVAHQSDLGDGRRLLKTHQLPIRWKSFSNLPWCWTAGTVTLCFSFRAHALFLKPCSALSSS